MLPQADLIVDISEAREKYFGCAGKMLIPCSATVEALIRTVPAGALITTDLLRTELARRFDVQATCPAATGTALRQIGKASTPGVPYWRVVKQNGDVMSTFPGGAAGQAALLA